MTVRTGEVKNASTTAAVKLQMFGKSAGGGVPTCSRADIPLKVGGPSLELTAAPFSRCDVTDVRGFDRI